MTLLIELNSSSSSQCVVPITCVDRSNGTTPETGEAGGQPMLTIGGRFLGATNNTLSAISAAAGEYVVVLQQSELSVLGNGEITYESAAALPWRTSFMVINNNLYSTQSNILVNDIAADSYSGVTIQGLSNYANISDVTLHAGTHSDATVQGVSNYANISNVTLHAGTHSDVTIQGVTRINSSVTIRDAAYSAVTVRADGLVAASFQAGAIDAAALATDAGQEIADRLLQRNIAGGADSTRSVGEAFMALRNRTQLSDVSYIVYQGDDTTIAWHGSLTTVDNTVRVTDVNP